MTAAIAALTETKTSKEKRFRPKVLRSWFVGSLPLAHLFRNQLATDGGIVCSYYLSTPSVSLPLTGATEQEVLTAADRMVIQLVTARPPIAPPDVDPTLFDGRRVIFDVVAASVTPTTDEVEHALDPRRVHLPQPNPPGL